MGSGRRTNGAMEEILSLVWCNPLITGTVLLLLFTPPFFPLLVYFSPLLMTTALWAAALVSIGPWQIEKQPIEAQREEEEEEEEGSNYCVDRRWWQQRRRQDDASAAWIYWSGGGGEVVRSGMWSSGELPRASAETVHGAAAQQRRTTTPASNEFMEEEKDRWTMWVKEYETRLEWNQATAAPSQDGGFAAAVKREQEMKLEKESLKLETQKFKERFKQLATELSTGDTVQILTCLFCPLKPKK